MGTPETTTNHEHQKAVAGVLAEHRWIDMFFQWTGCSCDRLWWKGYESTNQSLEDMYLLHVADMLLTSDALRGIRAQELRDAAEEIDNGPTFPLPPSVVSALVQERADRIIEGTSDDA